jgi:phenylpyruvate tautomerase PptA (4-oxalocrotonate tautomerase family)
MTRWAPKVAMTFAGTTEACAMVRVALIGSASPNARSTLTSELSNLLEASGVPKARVFVTFTEVAATHWGLSGSLFG